MQLYAVLADVLPAVLDAALTATPDDPTPEPEDVKAGWTAFAIFLGLAAAVAFLGWALTKQLKRTEANRRAGVFGPVDDEEEAAEPGTSDRQTEPEIEPQTKHRDERGPDAQA